MASEDRVIIVDPVAQAREQFNREMRQLLAAPLDRCVRPGGYFLNADGSGAHDAEGRAVPLRGQDSALAEELQQRAANRQQAVAEIEAQQLDSPEEVAERERSTPRARAPGHPFTPPAVPEGTMLQDGLPSQPSNLGGARQAKRASAKAAKRSHRRGASKRASRSGARRSGKRTQRPSAEPSSSEQSGSVEG